MIRKEGGSFDAASDARYVDVETEMKTKKRSTAKLGWTLDCRVRVATPTGATESKAELRIQETRVPKTWSPERRAEALAGQLRRKIRPERIAGLLNVLGSTHRIRVLMTLAGGGVTYQHLVKATKLKAGPLYHHVNQLRLVGLIRPRERDLYEITPKGTRALLMAAGMAGMR